MSSTYLFLLLFGSGICSLGVTANEVLSLPGTSFETNFRQFAGYLNFTTDNNGFGELHYWFIQSQNVASSDPLFLLIAGNTGCSSVFALLEEFGPFRTYADAQKLYENVFSLNKVVNLLAIDQPGVGFSPFSNQTFDNEMASQALLSALSSFYTLFPQFSSNDLYLLGENDGSIIATELAYKLQQKIKQDNSAHTFKGLILANSVLDSKNEFNAFFPIAYTHGLAGKDEWNQLRSVCCVNSSTLSCNYHNNLDQKCFQLSSELREQWMNKKLNSVNLYQDCYSDQFSTPVISESPRSTDFQNGYPCRSKVNTKQYLDLPEVGNALYSTLPAGNFQQCRPQTVSDIDLSIQLSSIINYGERFNPISILIYNGDLDFVNNFLGAQWFAKKFAADMLFSLASDSLWYFNYDQEVFSNMEGGMATVYSNGFNVLSVRGGGAATAVDRPAQVLQIVRNFIGKTNFSTGLQGISLAANPLLPAFQLNETSAERRRKDQITHLPGLTFSLYYKQYSGYLNAAPTHKLFYWLIESYLSPETAPLLIWLGGGPGIPATWSLFTDNGPFRVNTDGKTLFENQYAWNKFAHVLYLDSPHSTGFSYSTKQNDTAFNDELTTEDNFAALQDFLRIYPEFANRPCYFVGNSYAGVFIPLLFDKILHGIYNGEISMNIQGMILENAMVSAKHQTNSAVFQQYVYGIIGQKEYDEFISNCCDQVDSTKCDFYSEYMYTNNKGQLKPINDNNKFCSDKIVHFATNNVYYTFNDAYSMYQDCYSTLQPSKTNGTNATGHAFNAMQYSSTDTLGGYPCYGDSATTSYLNELEVLNALHVAPDAPKWSTINLELWLGQYNRSHFEMQETLKSIINNYIYKDKEMRILLLNGDTDLTGNHIGSQWFLEEIASDLNLQSGRHLSWNYQRNAKYKAQVGGFYKAFSKGVAYATVRGSGQETGLDRPGPVFQFIYNYINHINVSTPFYHSVNLSPPLPAYSNLPECQEPVYPKPSEIPQERAEKEENSQFNTANLTAKAAANLVSNLPGLTFNPNFRHFAGYLNPKQYPQNHLFYWFLESQDNPSNDPVLLWLDGGPGCSSIGGLFKQAGAIHPNNDNGRTILENIYSWNKKASILFIESPVGVGFSYTLDSTYEWNDDTTAANNAGALEFFFTELFPSLADNPFYVVSQSYGGVYGPTLTLLLAQEIDAGRLHVNLKGMAVGNGYFSHSLQDNSQLVLQYGRGISGLDDWNVISSTCCPNTTNPIYCDYSSFPVDSECYKATRKLLNQFSNSGIESINIYQDCYNTLLHPFSSSQSFTNQNDKIWTDSTDPFHGFPCWNAANIIAYMNRNDVKKAIHADSQWAIQKEWTDCENWPDSKYEMQPKYFDMSTVLTQLLNTNTYSKNNMSILLFTGDVDFLCEFMGNQWFVEKFANSMNLQVMQNRSAWTYNWGPSYLNTIAGYAKSWTSNIHSLTIKGAGHLALMDRPAQALQMINNFIFGRDFSTSLEVDLTPQPLLPQYNQTHNCTIQQVDRITTMPGLLQFLPFKQYSGYLKGSNTHLLHYWLVESTTSPADVPLLLWLNGGPGQSSLLGLFQENGPFRISKDGNEVYLNPNSWNKFLNILFLESPVGVGYSYSSEGTAVQYNDNNTATENYAALVDFFAKYPEYQKREFYIAGESYGGVYVPTLAKLLLNGIQNKEVVANFKGIAIGNGVLNKPALVDTLYHLMYYHGTISFSEYSDLLSACCSNVTDEMNCNLSVHVTNWSSVVYQGNQNDTCFQKINQLGVDVLMGRFDPYNPYQQCFSNEKENTTRKIVGETWSGVNYDSSDGNYGYYCYMETALENYLNKPDVRSSLHIPEGVPKWVGTSSLLFSYNQQNPDVGPFLKDIIQSAIPLKVLIYNGDVDTACTWMAADKFANSLLLDELGLQITSKRAPWMFSTETSSVVAGYVKRFSQSVDLLTVKGSGHLTALDRPAPVLQMIYNWIRNTDYSSSISTNGPLSTSTHRTTVSGTQSGNPSSVPTISSTVIPTTTTSLANLMLYQLPLILSLILLF